MGTNRVYSTKGRGPTEYELEQRRMPPSSSLGYYIPLVGGKYDTSACSPSYSENRITPQMITAMTNEIETHPDFTISTCNWLCLIPLLGLVLIVIGQLLMVYTSIGKISISSTSNSSTSSTSQSSFPILTVILAIVGVIILIGGCCCINRQNSAKAQRRSMMISQTLAKHTSTTFAGIPVVIKESTHGAYISIEFTWRNNGIPGQQLAQPWSQPPVNYQGVPMQQGFTPYPSNMQYPMNPYPGTAVPAPPPF